MKPGKFRRIPTETFQPTVANAKRLMALKNKRGERTRIINLALDLMYKSDETVSGRPQ